MAERQRQRLLSLRNDPDLARFRVEGTANGKPLGVGSYGSVEEIMVDGLVCAGKKLHEALIDADNDGAANLAVKYVEECRIMSNLRHPNIALFLGVCFLPDSLLPVLLIEKLECSLDDLIENIPKIPLALKRSMLEDVARGVLYLHKHNVIHRDLTARNVLLTSSLVAKVTDFGNSRFVDFQPGQLARTLSRLPGTLVYMPPEALEESSCYGPSLDIFSFGHLALFVGLQKFPGTLLQPNYPDPQDPDNFLGRSEVRRREQYFIQLQDLLPGEIRQVLVELIENCLRNDPFRRPTAEKVVSSLEEMKGEVEGAYGELATVDAVRQVRTVKILKDKDKDKNEEIQQLQQQLEAAEVRHKTELHQKDEQKNVDMTRLQVTHEADLHHKDTRIEQQSRTIHQLNTQLTEKDERLREKETQLQQKNANIIRLQRELQESLETARLQSGAELTSEKPGEQTPLTELKLPLKLKWSRGKDMPFGMIDYPQALLLNGKVYLGGGGSNSESQTVTVLVYDPQLDSYDTLPPYTCRYFSMTVVNKQLVLVGGIDLQTRKETTKLGVWNEQSKTWTHPLPPMTAGCSSPSVAVHSNRWLLVMGGIGDDGIVLSRVEILDTTESRQWYCAAPLPQPCYRVSTVTISNICYLLGGSTARGQSSKKVVCVIMDNLIAQAVAQPPGSSTPSTPSPWTTIPDTPLVHSTALCLNGALLAVGGNIWGCKTIYHYQPSTRSWIKAGELPAGRGCCACTVLPSGELFVAGGFINNKIVDIALIE